MLVGKTDAEQLTLRLTEEAVQVKRYVTALTEMTFMQAHVIYLMAV